MTHMTKSVVLILSGVMLAACDKPAEKSHSYNSKYDGISPNALSKPVDTSILTPRTRVALNPETPTNTPPTPTPATPAKPPVTEPTEGPINVPSDNPSGN